MKPKTGNQISNVVMPFTITIEDTGVCELLDKELACTCFCEKMELTATIFHTLKHIATLLTVKRRMRIYGYRLFNHAGENGA